jgi:hypothetical protein
MDEEEDDQKSELADANSVRVLETNVLHASDVLYWLDGTSATIEAEMSRIPHSLHVRLTEKPHDLKVLNSIGRMALWRKPDEAMIEGRATQEQRTRPALPNFEVAGEVRDPTGRYNPAVFAANVGDGSGVSVVLYPSLIGTKAPPAGVAQGRLLFDGSGSPVVWGLLELEVTVAVAETIIFRAQADKNGDFIIALNRLLPLPESITEYAAVLRLTADSTADGDAAPDASSFAAMELESTTVAGDFQTELVLEIRPGVTTRINSFNKDHIAIQIA